MKHSLGTMAVMVFLSLNMYFFYLWMRWGYMLYSISTVTDLFVLTSAQANRYFWPFKLVKTMWDVRFIWPYSIVEYLAQIPVTVYSYFLISVLLCLVSKRALKYQLLTLFYSAGLILLSYLLLNASQAMSVTHGIARLNALGIVSMGLATGGVLATSYVLISEIKRPNKL